MSAPTTQEIISGAELAIYAKASAVNSDETAGGRMFWSQRGDLAVSIRASDAASINLQVNGRSFSVSRDDAMSFAGAIIAALAGVQS